MDFSQVGRFGTLSLMKRQEPDTVVTAFGIDTDELTFGRDPKCSVRLYYSDINLVHCKIVFQERKAFLIVLGPTGLLVDGCRVYPNASSGGKQTTIPLSNKSEIEIHGKRFRFSYPPKEIRATLLATPAPHNRKLRLSMIQSAQVFSPAPSKDPRENLRILRSPMKNTFQSPRKPSHFSQSPITATRRGDVIEEQDEDKEEEGEEIVLVDGPHPRVVQEEKDLVILEEVDEPVPQSTVQIQPPKTPQRRRSQSLHRAVLIRSAQRAVVEHERQQKEEEKEREEEMEVADTITDADVSSDESHGGTPQAYRGDLSSDEETDGDKDEVPEDTKQDRRKSLWRKSIEKLWPFRNSTEEPEDNRDDEAEQEEESSGEETEDYERDEGQDEPEALPSLPQATPIRRHLGSFMTPQVGNKSGPLDRGESVDSSRGRLAGGPPVRYSLGGDARRAPFDSTWRVKDIVIPVKGDREESTLPEPDGGPSANASPRRPVALGPPQTSPVRSRPEISAEERKAIQERRRSALREVDSRAYFTGGIPGMSPSKASSTSPIKPGFNDLNNPFGPAAVSPTKRESMSPVKDEAKRLSTTDEEDEKMDTRSLLERMKETVEGMKRRRSTLGTSAPSPVKSSSDSNPFENEGIEPFALGSLESQDDSDEDKENDRNTMDVDEPIFVLQSPNKKGAIPSLRGEGVEDSVEDDEDDEDDEDKDIPVAPMVVHDSVTVDLSSQLEAAEQPPTRESNQLQVPVTRSRSRSRTKSPQPMVEVVAMEELVQDPTTEAERRGMREANATRDEEEASPAAAETRSEGKRVRKPATGEAEKLQTSKRVGRKTPTVDEGPSTGPKRTSRRTTVKEEAADAPVAPAPTRRGRPPATTKAATRQKSSERAKRPPSRARSGAKTPVNVDDGDDDNDPLDSITPSERTKPAVLAKSTTTRGRRPRSGVKQEETDVLKASTRSRTTTATTSKTPATRGPGRPRKTPATAPPAISQVIDKENTPEEGDSSSKSAAAADAARDEGVVVKVRSTTRKTRTTAVKQEAGVESSSGGGVARARITKGTRTASRTRTKTS